MCIYYCHECAALLGWMNIQNSQNLIATNYQLDKFIKHTTPSNYSGVVSVFDDPTYMNYATYLVNTSGSGCVEVDSTGRKSLIWVAGRNTGFTYNDGIFVRPEDAIRVVLFEDQWRIHAFPTNSIIVNSRRCFSCGKLVAY